MTVKRNRPMGAPLKLTPKLQKEFVKHVKAGNCFKPVCGCCGIARSTFYDWMAKGKDDKQKGKPTIYSDFMDTIRHAEAEAEIFMVRLWHKIIKAKLKLLKENPEKIDYRIIKNFLTCRYSDRWGRNVTQTNIGKLDIDVKELSNEELQEIVDGKLRRLPYSNHI